MTQPLISNLYFISMLPLSLTAVFICWRCFAQNGLVLFLSLAGIIANIQVLKTAEIFIFPEPIALGTIIFSTSFLASDMLTELYGTKTAVRATFLSLFAIIFFFVFMKLTINITPSAGPHPYANNINDSLKAIFSPTLIIAVSSLVAFLSSQLLDILCYKLIRKKSNTATSSFISSSIASIADHIIFILLAFKIFAYNKLPFSQIFFTYMFNITLLRITIAAINGLVLRLWLKR